MKFLIVFTVVAVVACNGLSHTFGMEHKGLKVRGGMSMVADGIPELRPPKSMYENAVAAGATKASNAPLKTFILGILSGCHIAFGGFMLLAVGGACPGLMASNPGLQKLVAGAFGLPFGLMMTLVTGGELFTGNTALVTAAVIEKKAAFKDLLKNWFFSYGGNFVGSLLMAYLVFNGKTLGVGAAAVNLTNMKLSAGFQTLFIRGVLCNWLVCMAVYMASGCTSLISKMVAIWFPISAFVALGLEHSIANMFIIPLGIMLGAPVTTNEFLMKNLLPVTLGNIVGGAVCVATAFSATYGSLLEKKPDASKVMGIRGGFTPSSKIVRASMNLNMMSDKPERKEFVSMVPNSEKSFAFMTPDARERGAVGNQIEKVKTKKDPATTWTDIHEYAAAIRAGSTNWEDIEKDELDIRIKYAGMFHRKKAIPGRFMVRLRLPNGIVNSDDMRYFADVVRPYGPEIGVVDITCRANIQLRSPPIEDCSDILKGLQARGLTSLQSGLDNLRNMVGSPIAGLDQHEIFDTRALAKEIDDMYTNHGKGNPEYANMPRKFNIAISGTRDDFAHTNINDIGLQACPHAVTGEIGFNVVVGGYISIKRACESIPLNAWIPASDAVPLCKAILRIFRDEGARGDRQKTRLMWLVESKTIEVFSEMVQQEMAVQMAKPSYKFELPQEHKDEWTNGHRDVNGVHAQRQEGLSFVGVHVPVGRLSADECVEIADLADKYSSKEVRFTVEQNLLFPNIPNDKIAQFSAEPIFTRKGSRLTINPGHIVGHVVSCTGAQFCPLAMVETKLSIDDITRKLELMVTIPKPVRIHMTGCPNSCGQVQVADIGLMGAPAKKMNAAGELKAVPGVNIFIGGKVGEAASLMMEPALKGIPMSEEDILPVLAKILCDTYGGKMITSEIPVLASTYAHSM